MSELEELRQRRIKQLVEQQRQGQGQQLQQQMKEQEIEAQIKLIIAQILTPEARERLSNIRLARSQFARQIEIFLIQLHQAGKLPQKLTDEQLKQILEKLKQGKREFSITRE